MSILSELAEGGLSGVFKGVRDVIAQFKADPLELAKLEAALQTAELQAKAQLVQAVNQTMQSEAKSEHWIQYSWRPTVGFTFAGTIINNYILLPYFSKVGLQSIEIPDALWGAILVVLGAAAYTRGQEKIAKLK